MQLQHFFKTYSNLILFGILFLAFGLRYYKIDEHGLAGDEKYGLMVSQFVAQEGSNQSESIRKPNSVYFTPKEFWTEKGFSDFEIAIANRENGTAGLYAIVIHFFTKTFGVSDFTLRFPSLVFNLLTILLLFLFVKRHLKSQNLALLSAFLAAISPFFINYSQIGRTYSMLCFFALLSTHLLLLIVSQEENDKRPKSLYVLYGLIVWANLMSHYSILPLFIIHGLYCLLFFRKPRGWVGLCLAMLIPLAGMVYWLRFGGGQWSMHAIHQSAIANSLMAQRFPNDWLAITSFSTIINQIKHIIGIQFIIIDGVSFAVSGVKNFILSIVLAIFLILIVEFINNKKVQIAIVLGLNFVAFFVFTVAPFQHLILSVALFILYLLLKQQLFEFNQKRFFILLLAIIPVVFSVIFAVQDGNTMRVIPRYIAYSYSFAIILVALGIKYVLLQKGFVKYFVLSILLIQIGFLFGLIKNIYADKPLYYFQTFSVPRTQNPYIVAANKIMKTYAKGDTIIYPSYTEKTIFKGYNMPEFSVQDAQYVNFFLPKKSDIIQRVNPNEPNKIILKKSDGNETVIFDFEGSKFRY